MNVQGAEKEILPGSILRCLSSETVFELHAHSPKNAHDFPDSSIA
jgi:hypothetical protein